MTRQQIYLFVTMVCIWLMGCGSASLSDQGGVNYDLQDSLLLHKYDFIDLKSDTICDPQGSLKPFYDALARVEAARPDEIPQVASIIHYGDSHIQGGVFPQTIMRHFARRYGSAGRGMIVPYKIARTNEPRDYAILSKDAHTSLMVTERGAELSRGVSGVSVRAAAGAQYVVCALDQPEYEIDHLFSRVVVFHDSLAPIIEAANPDLTDEGGGDDFFRSYVTSISLLEPTDSLRLVTRSDPPFSSGAIYGFSLENNRSGVIYHALGVNGACYLHWGRYDQIAIQSQALNPNLIILSMGSNEAAGNNFIESVFLDQVDSFVSKLRAANPDASILLTSPPEAMRKVRGGRRPNENFEKVSLALARYAAENGVAFFDLYRATSGQGSALKWLVNSMQSRDGIHYTAEGYEIQGLLIYRALQNDMKDGSAR